MAQGTGLPNLPGVEGITPLVDLTSSAGAAERATATALDHLSESFGEAATPYINAMGRRRGQREAAEDVAAGRFNLRLGVSEGGQVYNRAMMQGTVARLRTQVDAEVGEIASRYQADPDGFQHEVTQFRSGFARNLPPEVAVETAAYFDDAATGQRNRIRVNQVTEQRAVQGRGLAARLTTLETAGSNRLADDHTLSFNSDPVMLATRREYRENLDALVALRMMSPEEANIRERQTATLWQAAAFRAHIRNIRETQGPDAAIAAIQEMRLPHPVTVVTPSAGTAMPGLLEQGNIDLSDRPVVLNEDGTVSTVRSITIEVDGRHVLIPTVSDDGRILTTEEATAAYRETGRNLGAFATEEAATSYAQMLHTDQQQAVERGMRLQPDQRAIAAAAAEQDLQLSMQADRDRLQIRTAAQTVATTAMRRRMDDYVGQVALTGGGTELSTAEVMAVGGPGMVAELAARTTEALRTFQTRGDVARLTPVEAAERGLIGSNQTAALGRLPEGVENPSQLQAVLTAMEIVETRGRPAQISRDPDGAGPAGGGAVGAMQLLPGTARRMAALINEPYDERRLLNDPAYNRRLGTRYMQFLMERYGGSVFLAVTAYHAGEGNTDRWVQRFGDPRVVGRDAWLARVRAAGNPRSADYPMQVAAALPSGMAGVMWSEQNRAPGAWENARSGYESDPIDFARTHRYATLTPLLGTGAPQTAQALAAALVQRRDTGAMLARRDGVPLRFLTNAERDTLRSRIEADPTLAVQLATSATATIGAAHATALMRELGQGTGSRTPVHIGILAVDGDQNFARTAAQGLALRAGTARLSRERREDLDSAMDRFRPAFARLPQTLMTARDTAEAAMIADEAAGISRPARYYVEASLGTVQVNGRVYGGVAQFNGSSVPLPLWLARDYADDALRSIGTSWERTGLGPRYSNGARVPAREIATARLIAMPNGNYVLTDRRGNILLNQRRQPFQIDLEANRQHLRESLPAGSVR